MIPIDDLSDEQYRTEFARRLEAIHKLQCPVAIKHLQCNLILSFERRDLMGEFVISDLAGKHAVDEAHLSPLHQRAA